jgi:hypothetical protein
MTANPSNWYVAVWSDPYNHESAALMFGVTKGMVVETSPFMPWAKGRPLRLVEQYFRSQHAAFYEVKR